MTSMDIERATRALESLRQVPVDPQILTEVELAGQEFPEPRWAVPGLLPTGLTLLAGAPKLGKSWLLLNVAAAIASGGHALGRLPVPEGDALVLALEDTPRRVQERMNIIRQGGAPSARLHLATTWPAADMGGLSALRLWLSDHPETRLVGVDVLARLREQGSPSDRFAAEYRAVASLKDVADEFDLAIIAVLHTRKAEADDPFDRVSGTRGLVAAADSCFVLQREIGRHDATLYVRGRDVPEAEHALEFDQVTCAWTILGNAEQFRMADGRATISALLEEHAALRPAEIASLLKSNPSTVRSALHRMAKAGQVIERSGAYSLPIATAGMYATQRSHAGEGVARVSQDATKGATQKLAQRRQNLEGVAAVAPVAGGRNGTPKSNILQFPGTAMPWELEAEDEEK